MRLSWNENENENRQEKRRCQICRIYDSAKTPLIQAGDFCYLCSLCHGKRGQRWTFSDAWKYRYANGYKNERTTERRDKCYYCGNLDYLVDIFDKKHPNLMHSYQGHQECAYCKYEREVVNPRHARIMAESPRYDATVYTVHTFRGTGASGLNVDAAVTRVKTESEARYRTVERKRAAYQEFKKRQDAIDAAETAAADDNDDK